MSTNEDFPPRSTISDLGRRFLNELVKYVPSKLPVGDSSLYVGAIEGAHKKYSWHRNYKPIGLRIGDERWNYLSYTSFGRRSILAEVGLKETVVKPFGDMFTR